MMIRKHFDNLALFSITLLLLGIMSATAECVTIPNGPDVPTQKDFDSKYLKWLQRVTIQAYSESTPDPDPRLLDFLGNAIRVEVETADAPEIKSVIDQGASLFNSGNRSPWLLGWYGIILVRANRHSDAVPIFQEALAGFENTENMNVQASFITGYLAEALDKGTRTERALSRDMMLKHIARFTRAVSERAFPGNDIQIAYRLISTRFIDPLNKQRWKHYHEQLEKLPNVDPWLKCMIEGRTEHQRGWDARGGGYANTVTAEGWAGMEKHGHLAYKALKKAYDVHPEFPEAVRFLLENGINLNDKGVINMSPLRYAINKGQMDIVGMLLEYGAAIESNENETMLFAAVSQQNVQLINLLLKHGVDINEADVYGRTPIHAAVIKNKMMLCRYLIENGADVNHISGNHESLLQIALHHKAYDVARLLLKQDINVNVVDGNGYSPVYFALDAGELDIARSIINKGLDLNITSPTGYPILHTAAFYGYTEILQLLLEKGADINQKYNGHTAKEFADHYKKPEAAKFLKTWKRNHKPARK